MSWGKLLQPDLFLGSSILDLTPEMLRQQNLKGLVLDVDETLVPISMAETSPELHQWLQRLDRSMQVWLVSNNISQARISRIAKTLERPYILGARKPSRRKLRQAVEAMGLPVEQVAMVGDRLFTDVLAGNRLGMYTILVEPMVNPAKLKQRNLLRDLEVWLSQILGVTLVQGLPPQMQPIQQQSVTDPDKT
ncbi:MAG: YqeG family HAD IIIA-type phosphatase [Pegethrix bostrychoides GSE-TBD4-15B]|uniref:YqeG family HAD IIIA-type phosphatase n=1 Tax=Pegethrix bostrychoides GSE-TBD4-15B TaxID=2839662 RepID=A0A951PCC8_9CYAN|nr:YqeG family HAD IIIA-type phosphatase [Pegethrix bostrychoides GSE-TBD4-15B]